MDNKSMEYIMKSGIEMYESLLESIDKAGGTGSDFIPINKLYNMTVMQLISYLATNNIRFYFKGPK